LIQEPVLQKQISGSPMISDLHALMNFSIEHLGLPARDPAKLKDWYVSTLGAELVFSDGATPGVFFVRLPGGEMIEIYQAGSSLKETCDNKLAGWRHVALRVESIESAKALLEQRGVRFSEAIKPAAANGRVLFFEDAEGNLMHLVDRAADSPLA
jgi:glyoxylase I family protein